MTHAISDSDGLICGFRLSPLAPCGAEALSVDGSDGPVWLHLNLADARATRWLEQRSPMPPEARELLTSPESRISLRLFPDGFVAVLGDVQHELGADPDVLGDLRIYVDAERMITARLRPLKAVDNLRRDLRHHEGELSPIQLFEHYLEALAETFHDVVVQLGDQVDDTEEEVFAGRYQHRGKALGRQRRLMVRLRRSLAADRAALSRLPGSLPAVFENEARQRLRQLIERFDAVAQDLELVQDRARLLKEEIEGRVGEATSRNLFVLSIVTTVLLPLTLITGLFGMNVKLPWGDSEHGFLWIAVLLGVSLGGTLLVLRKLRIM